MVTTVTAWCRSRSSSATAVVCSGRKRPQDSKGQWLATPEAAPLVGGGHEAEEQLGPDIVERCEAEVVDDDEVVAQEALDDPAHGVVGETPVEGLDEGRGGEVADPPAGHHRGLPEAEEQV